MTGEGSLDAPTREPLAWRDPDFTDPAKLEAVYAEAMNLPSKPYPSIEGLKNMQSIYTWREIENKKPEDFTDSSFIAELDKSGYIDSLYKKKAAAGGK